MAVENQSDTRYDWLKWLVISVLIVAGLIANYYYSQQPWPLRVLGWLLLLAIAVVIALQTYLGKQALGFARESRVELRKVVWPTRQETMQTTLVVGAMVVLIALLLWGIDGMLVWIIGWLTGQRG